MKHLQTYQQLNESQKVTEFIEDILNKFGEKVDSKKVLELLLPFKIQMNSLCNKYLTNGKVDADKIHSDLKSFNLTTEGYWDKTYDEDDKNNVILRLLYKFFVKWPKSFVAGMWSIFKMTVMETWQDDGILGKVISVVMLLMWIGTAVIVYLITLWTFLFIDMKMNGLTHGKVTEKQYQTAHYEDNPHTVMLGKTSITYYTHDYVPDRWYVQLKGEKGRVEDWVTYNAQVANQTTNGTEITKDDDWSWTNTEKRHGDGDDDWNSGK